MNKTIRAVLFDLDDTLLENNMERFLKAYFDLLTAFMARMVPPKKFMSALLHATSEMLNNTDPEITNQQTFINTFFPGVGRTPEEMMPVFDDFYAGQYGQLRSLTKPDPSARIAIQSALSAGCDVVLATNPVYPETAIRQRMDWAGVSDFPFRLVTSYEVMHATKPAECYYREILDDIRRSPDECIMVGDDWGNDIAPAMTAGLRVFWITKGIEKRRDLNSTASGPLSEFGDWFLGLRQTEAPVVMATKGDG
jgi:FMN phosphatase YigB (HAD superfamily)